MTAPDSACLHFSIRRTNLNSQGKIQGKRFVEAGFMKTQPKKRGVTLYVSKRTGKGLWQQYRIYSDRLELQSWILFHTLVVPTEEIQTIEVRPSVWTGARGITWGVKIDNCDLNRHVLLTKRSGLIRRIGFTPDDPGRFVEICRSIGLKVPDGASA